MKHSIMAAGLLAVVVTFSFGGTRAEAAPVPVGLSFAYSGTVGLITDPSNVTGLHVGDKITGSLIFDLLNDTFTTTTDTIGPPPGIPIGTTNHFLETGRFAFGAPGNPTVVNGVTGTVDSSHGGFIFTGSELVFDVANAGGDSLHLDFNGLLSGIPPLTSLTQLPADSTGMAALFGIAFLTAGGHINYLDSQIDFAVDVRPLASTPIPATLWLLLSALGGVGFVGWTRRRVVPVAVA